MNILIMFIAIGGALLVWWLLLQKLRTKSWLEHGANATALPGGDWQSPQLVGLGVFLAVVTALFALFGAAYHMRMAVPDWTHLPLPRLLWLNTVLLTLASAALQWAWHITARRRISLAAIQYALMTASCLTLLFFFGQWQAWRQLDASGFYFSCTPASAFFYVLSGLHALHLLGGFIVLTRAQVAAYRSASVPLLSIKLCALYWHYLLLLWVLLYALFALT